ncbi:hypothetical protein V2605_04855 [Tenacibaculum maritimum]|uniref:hypothetical protein n=1 Tax=Tenacibaculum maritimum TaxID=107401 RepID=UPI0012E491C4|nr:hypothetical protein [Tenacibaculum maritimum]CAA0233749.1 conserved exported hypothetical protein [Tenacibaculum maritimum]
MKFWILLLSLFFSLTIFGQVNPNYHKVKGYYRKDGTYVKPHYRTNRNNTNRDNYTTKPNVNPHTGKRGYIEPDNKPNYNYNYSRPSSSYSNRNYSSSYKTSSVSFFTNYGQAGNTKIWIDGSYKGSLNSYFNYGSPNCGQNGTLKVALTPGKHTYRAEDGAGFYWEGSFTTSANSCETLKLNSSAESRYNLGISRAKQNYKTSYINYIVPFTVTAFDPYIGAGTTLTIDLFPPNHYKTGDRNFDKGYRKVARRKKILATVISFGLGFLTHELIGDELNESINGTY